MDETRDGEAGVAARPPQRPAAEREAAHGMPGEFGCLLEEALGRGAGRLAPPEPVSVTAKVVDGSGVLDDSLVVAVSARTSAAADTGSMADIPPPYEPRPTVNITAAGVTPDLVVADPVGLEHLGAPGAVDTSAPAGTGGLTQGVQTAPSADTTDPAASGAPRPTTVEGRVELDTAWMDRPLLRQPVVLRPGASVGPPGGGSYIANPGSIPVTFVPSGTSGRSAGTYFVDPAEVAAAAGPDGLVTDLLMAQLSGRPYPAGPPTAIQMAIIDAARQAGLRLGTSS